ncbi:MAG: phage holin family protein [Actinobacteria bacterium]|nr:phage holin family protein [Actinomycetota bacterium]
MTEQPSSESSSNRPPVASSGTTGGASYGGYSAPSTEEGSAGGFPPGSVGARVGAVANSLRFANRSGKSAGQLVKEVSEDFSTLLRKEIELAKTELGQAISVKAKGAAIVAIAAVFGFFALIFLLLGLRDGLDTFLWRWVADLLTAVILLIIGGIAVLVARRLLREPVKADMTKQTIREDVEWAKTLGRS